MSDDGRHGVLQVRSAETPVAVLRLFLLGIVVHLQEDRLKDKSLPQEGGS